MSVNLTVKQLYESMKIWNGNPMRDDMGGKASIVHDWRNHIPEEFIPIWSKLSTETRMALAIVAERLADREEWE